MKLGNLLNGDKTLAFHRNDDHTFTVKYNNGIDPTFTFVKSGLSDLNAEIKQFLK